METVRNLSAIMQENEQKEYRRTGNQRLKNTDEMGKN